MQTTESDLPICAPNAVCSKIDLYETPWIERQCRCPKSTYMKHPRIIYHPKDNNIPTRNNYRHLIEQKVKISSKDDTEYDVENGHLKNLLHKLGVIYNQDDIMLDTEYGDYDNANMNNNVENHPYINKFDGRSNTVIQDMLATKLRHSAHRDVPRIGGCPSAVNADDGHTIADKTRLYKLCDPVHKLPVCRLV